MTSGENRIDAAPEQTEHSFVVRQANSNDAAGILACLASAFAPYRDRYTPEGFRDTVLSEETVGRRLAEMHVLVAEAHGRLVGTIGSVCHGREGHLRGMAVLAEWQGTGVATALLQAAENDLRGAGCRIVTLDTTEPLQRAVRFYQKHGFVASGRVSDFFGMPLYEYVKQLR